MININNVDIKKMVLSTKTLYGNKRANKYYVGYLNDGFKQLKIVIKDTEMCANNMHILRDPANFLNTSKYGLRLYFYLIKTHLRTLHMILNT